MRRIAGLSNKKPLKKPAAKVSRRPPQPKKRKKRKPQSVPPLHANDLFGAVFKSIPAQDLEIWSRHFPAHMRADLQAPLEALMASADLLRRRHPALSLRDLDHDAPDEPRDRDRVEVGSLSFVEVDVGEDEPVRCAMNAFILRHAPLPHAIFVSAGNDPTEDKVVRVEIAVPRDHPDGQDFASQCLRPFSDAVAQARRTAARCSRLRSTTLRRPGRRHPGPSHEARRSVGGDPPAPTRSCSITACSTS